MLPQLLRCRCLSANAKRVYSHLASEVPGARLLALTAGSNSGPTAT